MGPHVKELMKKLIDVVQENSENERILLDKKYIVKDSWKSKIGRLPVAFGKYRYMKPLQVIETENSIYIDRRPAYLEQSAYSIIPSFLIGLLALYFAWQNSIYILYLFSIFALLVPFINIIINNSAANILLISKDWVTNDFEESGVRTISGVLPPGRSYSPSQSNGIMWRIGSRMSTTMKQSAEFTIGLHETK